MSSVIAKQPPYCLAGAEQRVGGRVKYCLNILEEGLYPILVFPVYKCRQIMKVPDVFFAAEFSKPVTTVHYPLSTKISENYAFILEIQKVEAGKP